jgi:hypothetical protein
VLVASANKTRELHTGTAGKSQGRRKKKIQPSAVQIAKRASSGVEKEDDAHDEGYSLDSEDKESKGILASSTLGCSTCISVPNSAATGCQVGVSWLLHTTHAFGEAAIEADQS